MKKLLNIFIRGVLISALCVGSAACNEPKGPESPDLPNPPKEPQEVSFYYVKGQKVELKVLKDRVIAKAASFEEAKVLCENEIFIFEGPPHATGKFVLASIDSQKTTIEDVRKVPGILGATHGLESDDGFKCWPTDQIFVRPTKGISIESVIDKAWFKEYVEETKLFDAYSGSYLITLNLNLEYILWASNELFETGLCEYTEPSFFREAILD